MSLAAIDPAQDVAKLKRRLERERQSRLDAELIAEKGLRELYEKQRQLQVLEKIAVASNQSASVRDALHLAITTVCEFTGWNFGHAYLCEGDERRLKPTAIWVGRDCKRAQAFVEETESTSFAPGVGLPGRVLETGSPAWVVDVAADENFPRAAAARDAGIQAALAFPILAGREVVAVLEFFAETALEPDPVLAGLMSQIGTQLGRVVERARAEERLIHDASHDPLTGLPNRALFMDRLRRAHLRNARDPQFEFSVLFIDLDRFKVVNDSLGHSAGDRLLIGLAERLSSVVLADGAGPDGRCKSADATLARLGGDEFLVLLEDARDATDAIILADRIKGALDSPFVVLGQEVYASASIGIATSSASIDSIDDLLRNADLALYRAKAQGKARYEIYDRTMYDAAVKRLSLEADLRKALRDDEFMLHYQPIVSTDEAEIVGFEALVRWRRDGELVYPGDFMAVAEDTGLILPLGLWVLREACRTMCRWNIAFPRPRPVWIAVNLSVRQFTQPDLVAQVRDVLKETGIDPEAVRLEITESIAMVNSERTAEVLAELRALGIRLSIDDFGTGYSSLAYLHRYPLDTVKIDRSFVAQIDRGAEGLQIIRTIVMLARNLGMGVVAEGVETSVHLDHLRAIGCELAQGYFFSRPIDATSAGLLLKARTPIRAGASQSTLASA